MNESGERWILFATIAMLTAGVMRVFDAEPVHVERRQRHRWPWLAQPLRQLGCARRC
jgi:hypothetical protein